jgi:hypothetical protein
MRTKKSLNLWVNKNLDTVISPKPNIRKIVNQSLEIASLSML